MELLILAIAALCVYALSLFSLLKFLSRIHEREKEKLIRQNDTLLDRLMFTQGKTWVSPPRAEPEATQKEEPPSEWKEF